MKTEIGKKIILNEIKLHEDNLSHYETALHVTLKGVENNRIWQEELKFKIAELKKELE